MKKRLISFLACGVLTASAVAGLTACGQETLTVWGSAAQQDTLKEMVAAYKEANPDLKYDIKVGICEEEWAYSNVSKDPSAAADVYAYSNDQLIPLLRVGALAKLGGQFLKDVKANNSAESVASGSVGYGTDSEAVYGYPYAADNSYFMFYNKSIVKDPSTLEGIIDDCAAAGKKIAWALDTPWYTAGWFFAFGGDYSVEYNEKYTETGVTINFDKECGVKASKAMAKLTTATFEKDGNKVKVFSGKSTSNTTIIDGFSDKSLAVAVSGTWNAKRIQELLGEDYGVCELPTVTVDGDTQRLYSFAGYKLYGVNPHSGDKLVEAHKLAAFLSSKEMQQKRFEKHLVGPTNKEAANLPDVLNNPAIKALNAQAAYTKAQTSVPSNFWEPLKNYGLNIIDDLVNEDGTGGKLAYSVQLAKMVEQIKGSVKS